jgi:hypothetical protein
MSHISRQSVNECRKPGTNSAILVRRSIENQFKHRSLGGTSSHILLLHAVKYEFQRYVVCQIWRSAPKSWDRLLLPSAPRSEDIEADLFGRINYSSRLDLRRHSPGEPRRMMSRSARTSLSMKACRGVWSGRQMPCVALVLDLGHRPLGPLFNFAI